MTIKDMCEAIAAEFHKNPDLWVRNKTTGRLLQGTTVTGEDIFNWDSRGELAHIWEWYEALLRPTAPNLKHRESERTEHNTREVGELDESIKRRTK